MYTKDAIARYFAVMASESLLWKIVSENFAGYGLRKSMEIFAEFAMNY